MTMKGSNFKFVGAGQRGLIERRTDGLVTALSRPVGLLRRARQAGNKALLTAQAVFRLSRPYDNSTIDFAG